MWEPRSSLNFKFPDVNYPDTHTDDESCCRWMSCRWWWAVEKYFDSFKAKIQHCPSHYTQSYKQKSSICRSRKSVQRIVEYIKRIQMKKNQSKQVLWPFLKRGPSFLDSCYVLWSTWAAFTEALTRLEWLIDTISVRRCLEINISNCSSSPLLSNAQ